jgi:hypothetical protein
MWCLLAPIVSEPLLNRILLTPQPSRLHRRLIIRLWLRCQCWSSPFRSWRRWRRKYSHPCFILLSLWIEAHPRTHLLQTRHEPLFFLRRKWTSSLRYRLPLRFLRGHWRSLRSITLRSAESSSALSIFAKS